MIRDLDFVATRAFFVECPDVYDGNIVGYQFLKGDTVHTGASLPGGYSALIVKATNSCGLNPRVKFEVARPYDGLRTLCVGLDNAERVFNQLRDEWFRQFKGASCMWCGGRHLGLDCPNRPTSPAPNFDLVPATGYSDSPRLDVSRPAIQAPQPKTPRELIKAAAEGMYVQDDGVIVFAGRPPSEDPAEQRPIEGGRLMLEAELAGIRGPLPRYYGDGDDDADQSCKQDDGKTRWGLLLAHMPKALEKCVEVRAYGESKYGTSESWKTVEPDRYLEAAQRHVMALFAGERVNVKDGNCHHAAQAIVDLLFFLENELRRERESVP